jgi:hypothetical protein
MNIKKGDWVAYTKEPSVQGRVMRLHFYRAYKAQDALIGNSRKCCVMVDVHDLRVIRRVGSHA